RDARPEIAVAFPGGQVLRPGRGVLRPGRDGDPHPGFGGRAVLGPGVDRPPLPPPRAVLRRGAEELPMTLRTRVARRPRKDEEGFVLFLAILPLFVLTAAGLALMFASNSEQILSSYQTMTSKTFYAADSGLQYATARIARDTNYVGGPLPK